jgi:carboxyl-terminal processing protease
LLKFVSFTIVNPIKTSSVSTYLPLFLGLTLALGIIIGAQFGATKLDGDDKVLNQTLKLREILFYVDREYVDSVDTNPLVEEAIGSMLEKLDPHSTYFPPKKAEIANASLQGGFDGIGVEFNMVRDTLMVMGVVPDGPSNKAGILPGDRIVMVDEDTIAGKGLSSQQIIETLRGPKGSSVFVKIQRRKEAELLGYTIQRDKIPTATVDASYLSTTNVGYIKLSSFGAQSAEEFREALSDLKSRGMEGLIIDLRGNPGGYMSAAEQIADELLGENALIVTQKGKQDKYLRETRAIKPGLFEEGPVVVLMDEYSASASEILAGALQDNDRALIVGRRSFGKGLVQRPIKLKDNSELRLTIARYYTPSGRSIQRPYENGLEEYQMDIASRFESGEVYDWHLQGVDTSEVFSTVSGRPVYGGGGISPDVYVPLDSQLVSAAVNRILSSQLLREMAIEYVENNELLIKAMSMTDAVQKQWLPADSWSIIQQRAKGLGITGSEDINKEEKEYLLNYYKAYIIRGIFGDTGFYRVLNLSDPMYLSALQAMPQAGVLAAK